MNGIAYITDARANQIKKGYTAEHDDQEALDALVVAASIMAMPSYLRTTDVLALWPWDDYCPLPKLPIGPPPFQDRIDELAKAGALCAAEIDRIMRRNGLPVG